MLLKQFTSPVPLAAVLLAVTAAPAMPQWEPSRTAWGDPDLQGNWSNATLTPLTRSRDTGLVLTTEEVAEIESGQAEFVREAAAPSDPNRPLPPGGSNPVCIDAATTCYNDVYRDPGERVAVVNGEPRSSLITIPEDGRVPAFTPAARDWLTEATQSSRHFGAYDNPENRPVAARCIVSFGSSAGPPMLPNYWYNNNYTIVQNRDHVVILAEMVHDVRIIRLGEQSPLPDHLKPYFGDSWGYWEGNTLVVETTNIHPDHSFRGVPQSIEGRIIERFTPVSEDEILYEFTIDDPVNYTAIWGGQLPFNRFDDQVLEYSCHEGNYALEGVLRGARFQEMEGGGN
ncbi:MAG: hypothetical protein MK239_02050 [Gemmatimonadetes bacterium]|nr:hypothetical protein [Gemmatimonadota bacterium]